MKLLSVIYDDNQIIGYIQSGQEYKLFNSFKGGKVELTKVEGKFKDYDHFVMVIGKFDPEFLFIKKPKEIKSLKYEDLVDIIKEYPILEE